MLKTTILILTCCLALPAFAKNADQLELANLDCKFGTYLEVTTCSNSELLRKHSVAMHMTTLTAEYLKFRDSHDVWVKNIKSCDTAECLDIQYVLRIKRLGEILAYQDLRALIEEDAHCGGATVGCYLIERVPLGTYEGNAVYMEKYEVRECFKECTESEIQFSVHEIKDGKRVASSAWVGIFKNPKVVLDYQSHLRPNVNAYSDIEIKTVRFGFRPWTGEDDYGIVLEVERDENSWKAIGDTTQILERYVH